MCNVTLIETEKRLAVYHCRKRFADTKNVFEIRNVPRGYSDAGAAAWMEEAARLIKTQQQEHAA